jgi:hypothetical protein
MVQHVFRKSLIKGENIRGAHTFLQKITKEIPEPPFKGRFGSQVEIWVPPQGSKNGNSVGPQMQIFIPKGDLVE